MTSGDPGPIDTSEAEERLAATTLRLIDTPSPSGGESSILMAVRETFDRDAFEILDEDDDVVFAAPRIRRVGASFVVLAGHVDTVPVGGASHPGYRDGDDLVGRGAADMKGGLAVMLELAGSLADGTVPSDLDVGFLFFGREELPITQSALLPLFERCPAAASIDLAIVMEPTANAIEIGCLGNLNARVVASGTAAHSARPWLGENAIHTAVQALAPIADLPDREVAIDGLVFREVVNVTTIRGGVAANVVPDHVEATVNYRYAPTQTPADAEARLRELLGQHQVELEVVGNAPPGPVAVSNPLLGRLRAAGDLPLGPKQAWTPVAEFATVGVDAINFGPGDPQYAHRDDERIDVRLLVRSREVLQAFLTPRGAGSDSDPLAERQRRTTSEEEA
jgi:succinyl-diaminopimelate desuccinylase